MDTFLKTSEDIREQIWKELGRATHDRHHAWRTPVLATATEGGGVNGVNGVNARTVVLRGAQAKHQLLEIYTDQRSSKVAELSAQPNACLVFWSPRLHWQLRVQAEWSIQTTGAEVAARWQAVRQTKSAGDYMTYLAPGASLPLGEGEGLAHVAEAVEENYFAILQARVIEIDWLELGREQHRRAKWVGEAWQWLSP
jgi:pyridoxine/pyridoxamine 5'-phosphate oxidase